MLHVAGEKRWRIYQRYFENPIPHDAFRVLPPSFHEKHHGPLSRELVLRPGRKKIRPEDAAAAGAVPTDGQPVAVPET